MPKSNEISSENITNLGNCSYCNCRTRGARKKSYIKLN